MTKNEIIEAWKSGKRIYWYNDISKTKSYMRYGYYEKAQPERYFDFDRIEYFIEDEGMFGNEYCSMLGIDNSSTAKHVEDQLKNASDVYIFVALDHHLMLSMMAEQLLLLKFIQFVIQS